MVRCIVVGCNNNSGQGSGKSFYRIPKVVVGRSLREEELSRRRREGFIAAISRADLTSSCSQTLENGRICSDHFISGKPAPLFDETSPSWLPTEKLGHEKVTRKRVLLSQERYQRKKARLERIAAQRAASASASARTVSEATSVSSVDTQAVGDISAEGAVQSSDAVEDTSPAVGFDAGEGTRYGLDTVEGAGLDAVESTGLDACEGTSHNLDASVEGAGHSLDAFESTSLDAFEDAGRGLDAVEGSGHCLVQTDLTVESISQLQVQLHTANARIMSFEDKLALLEPFTEKSFEDDKRTLFYTGLPNCDLLKAVFQFVAPSNVVRLRVLSDFQEFVATLMKLRLNPPLLDLAYRFNVSVSTISRAISRWTRHHGHSSTTTNTLA